MSDIEFIVRFLNGIARAGAEGKLRREVAKNIFADVFTTLPSEFSLRDNSHESKRQKVSESSYSRNTPRGIIPEDLAKLIDSSYLLEISKGQQILISRLQFEAGRLDKTSFNALIMPFLRSLAPMLRQRAIPLTSTSDYNPFYRKMVHLFVQHGLGPCPKPPTHWLRSRVRHKCHDCEALNKFLRDFTKRKESFLLPQEVREHLRDQLRSSSRTVKCETSNQGSETSLVVTKFEPEHQ